MGEGKIFDYLIDEFKLTREFQQVYMERYNDSIRFIDKLLEIKDKGARDEFFISYLAFNEVFAAVKDELSSILLFKKGYPLSRWRDPRNIPIPNPDQSYNINDRLLKSFDTLLKNNPLNLIPEKTPIDDKYYIDIYSSLMFNIGKMRTHDATLLSTAILHKADYFVTKDEQLKKEANKLLRESNNQVQLIGPSHGYNLLKKQKIE